MSNTSIPTERPTTEAALEGLLKKAYNYATKGDYDSALALCNWLIEDHSTRIAGLRRRAAVFEHQGSADQAVEDLELVVASGVDEPADIYSLGLLYLQIDRPRDAEAVLGRGVRLCEKEQFDYYLDSCRLLRAEALIRLRQGIDALDELKQLPDRFSVHVYGRGVRVKEEMIAEAQAQQ